MSVTEGQHEHSRSGDSDYVVVPVIVHHEPGKRETYRHRSVSGIVSAMFLVVLYLLIAAVDQCSGQSHSVSIYSAKYQQTITSSTLKWVEVVGSKYPQYMLLGGRIGSDDLFVCRAKDFGRQIPGYLIKPLCTVELAGKVENFSRFDVLTSVGNSSLTRWASWRRGLIHVDGAISTDEFYIMRTSETEDGNRYLGKLETKAEHQKARFVLQGQSISTQTSAEILVEVMPDRYELANIQFSGNKKRYNDLKTSSLTTKTYINNGSKPRGIHDEVAFPVTLEETWGHVDGMYTGTPTQIHLRGRATMEVSWGIPRQLVKEEIRFLEFELPPFSKIVLSVDGTMEIEQRPFTAVLESYFSQLRRVERRNVEGTHKTTNLTNVQIRKESFQLFEKPTDLPVLGQGQGPMQSADPETVQTSIQITMKSPSTTWEPSTEPSTSWSEQKSESSHDSGQSFQSPEIWVATDSVNDAARRSGACIQSGLNALVLASLSAVWLVDAL